MQFSRVFVRNYPALTAQLLSYRSRIDLISNNIVHISVQLFSNESLALEMVLGEDDLLHVLLTCMTYMINELTIPVELFEGGDVIIGSFLTFPFMENFKFYRVSPNS